MSFFNVYNTEVQNIIDEHAPLQTKVSLLRPNTQWYTDELHAAKRERCKAERQMRKTNLEVHKQTHKDKRVRSNNLILKCKNEYYSNKILEIGSDQKQLHKITVSWEINQTLYYQHIRMNMLYSINLENFSLRKKRQFGLI